MNRENILSRILILMVLILLILLISTINKGSLKELEKREKCIEVGYDWDQKIQKCIKNSERKYCENSIKKECDEIYNPVCGWFDLKKVRCVNYPCAKTFSNDCFACLNSNVNYYEEGVCPV